MSNLPPELIQKAKSVNTAEELLALAKENGIGLTEEEAKAYYEQLHNTGELSDDELGNVSGGACGYDSDGHLRVASHERRDCWTCPTCGGHKTVYDNGGENHICPDTSYPKQTFCARCKYYRDTAWQGICKLSANNKNERG